MNPKLPLGKIDPKILAMLLSQYTSAGKRVLIGAGIARQASRLKVLKSGRGERSKMVSGSP